MTAMHPRTTEHVVGHKAALTTLRQGIRSDRMPHAWIISGERGSGKATLAYHFARSLLANTPEEDLSSTHPVFRRVAAASHSDLLTIEPEFDEKKDERKQEIGVEQARRIASFLALTAGEGAHRIAIIDSADELTVPAANAILKIIEEPPLGALLLLISHNPGRLLPTLRSRCRMLKLPALSADAFYQVMRQLSPELSRDDIATLAGLSHYAPGVAQQLVNQNGLTLYATILALFQQFPHLPAEEITTLVESVTGGKSHARFQVVYHLILNVLSIASGAGGTPNPVEEGAKNVMQRYYPPVEWARRYAEAAQQFSLAARLHLDYKTVLSAFFHSLPHPLISWNRTVFI